MTKREDLKHYLEGIEYRRFRFARLCPACGCPAKDALKGESCHGYDRRSHQNVWKVPVDA